MKDMLQKRIPMDPLPAWTGPTRSEAARTGGRVVEARKYPWWKSSLFTINRASGAAFSTWQWLDAGGQNAFRNDRDYAINIDEIRFYARVPKSYDDILGRLQCMIRTDRLGDVVATWLPMTALQTQIDQFIRSYMMSGLFRLPAPYFMGYTHAFRMDFTSLVADVVGGNLEVALHGRDPIHDSPIVLDKHTITMPAIGATVSIAFDEDRDNSLRDAWLDHITFSWTTIASQGAYPDPEAFNQIGVKFYPPSGIQWSFDTFTPLSMLLENATVEDMAALQAPLYFPQVIHKPVTPYILGPSQNMVIKGMVPFAPGGYAADIPVYCLVRGTQEPPK